MLSSLIKITNNTETLDCLSASDLFSSTPAEMLASRIGA